MVSMPRRIAIAVAVVLVMAFRFADAATPNVVIILGDDVGYGDIRANNPSSFVATPAIDRLASEGMRFTDGHAGSKCAPSRYMLMTGNYNFRGAYPWGQWHYLQGSAMLPGQETIGGLAQRAGYVTSYIGKSHLGGDFYRKGSNQFAVKSTPDAQVDFARGMQNGFGPNGWSESFALLRGIQGSPYSYFRNDALVGDPNALIHWPTGPQILIAGSGDADWDARAVGQRLVDESREFIGRNATGQFLLVLNTHAVHSPILPGPDYRGLSGSSVRFDMLLEFDGMVGAVVDELEQQGILDDTLVIVTSDNGAVANQFGLTKGHDSSGGRRGSKSSIYEGGHRVPFIVRGPGIEHGSVSSALVGIIDLYATVGELLDLPADADDGRDSISILPILTGQATSVRGSMIHESRDPEPTGTITADHWAWRREGWKLVIVGGVGVELYDLAADPMESNNVIGSNSAKAANMLASFEQARSSPRTSSRLR